LFEEEWLFASMASCYEAVKVLYLIPSQLTLVILLQVTTFGSETVYVSELSVSGSSGSVWCGSALK
jgi:uncharacterized membrane protein